MKRIAIYAHYDHDGKIQPYVRHYLASLREHCDELHFVSTAALDENQLASMGDLCASAVVKENRGYDFGMWNHVMAKLDLDACDELLLANSSTFGPIFPLHEMFDHMAGVDCDFWGATDNFDMDWHLQSYFIVFRKNVLQSESFAMFWNSVLPYTNKNQLIRAYEIGLSQFLCENGFRGQAYVSLEDLFPPWPLDLVYLQRYRSAPAFYPMRLIERRVPLVKIETLRENPGRVRLQPIYDAMRAAGFNMDWVRFDSRPKSRKRRGRKRWRKAAKGPSELSRWIRRKERG